MSNRGTKERGGTDHAVGEAHKYAAAVGGDGSGRPFEGRYRDGRRLGPLPSFLLGLLLGGLGLGGLGLADGLSLGGLCLGPLLGCGLPLGHGPALDLLWVDVLSQRLEILGRPGL